ncbi:ABC transporter substrate-binding protein [Paenibacillus azoreducens]|uniref:ABC transporter substrate-binding protein n=1 Tax=Paenibacillus azoreducens TaxID=116718 RepID=UPI0039F45E42
MHLSSRTPKKQYKMCAMLLAAAVWIAGCGNEKQTAADSGSENSVPASSQNNATSYPKTISVAGKDVTIPKKPEKIAAISLDSADAALELVDPERMALVSTSITNSSLAYRTAEGEKVKNKIAGATSLDPEQVLSSNADLLIMTKLHDKEKEANAILEQSGIPIITLESWSTLESVMNNIMVIGQAVGEEAKAESIVADMQTKLEKTTKAIEGASRPSVLVVSPLGPGTGPYLIGSSNISYDLVRLAGAEHAAENLGLKRTTKASIEQIIKADPEYILLVEWQAGKTDDMNEIMQTPGWSTLKAVKNNHVLSMPAKKLLNPNRYNVDTLEEIAKWLHPDKF